MQSETRWGHPATERTPPDENQVSKTNYEHLIIFVDATETRQVWQVGQARIRQASRRPRIALRQGSDGNSSAATPARHRVHPGGRGHLGITDVTEKFQQSLDIERVTKRFYDRFRKELTAFQKFIDGFTEQGDREWYASLMLNRIDVRLFHPEARLPERRRALPTQPLVESPRTGRSRPGSSASTANSCCACSTKDSASQKPTGRLN